MTASGTAGHADELEAYGPARRARRGGGQVAVRRAVARQPRAPGAPGRRRACSTAWGSRGPGIAAWVRDDLPRLAAAGARVVVSIWGQRVDDYAQAAAAAGRRRRADRRRGQRELPQHRGPPPHVRPLARRPPPRCVGAVAARVPGPAAVGQAEPDRGRPGRGGRRGPRPRGRGRHPGQHRARHGHRPRAPRRPCSARARPAAGCRGRRSTRSPSGPCSTSGPPTPTPPSSGWAG